jgi:hypothetical protein
MDALERLLIERECERLVALYSHRIDLQRAEGLPDLFTDDALMMIGEESLKGGAELRERIAGLDANIAMRHVCTNVVIDVLSESEARGTAYLTAYVEPRTSEGPAPLPGPLMLGEYRDVYRKTPDGWRIAERRFSPSFQRG